MSTDPARHSRGRVFDCIHHSPSPRDASSTTSSTTHDAAFSADSGAPQERERVTQSALSELGASIRRRGVPYGLSARARARLADVADGEGTGVTRAEAIPVQDVRLVRGRDGEFADDVSTVVPRRHVAEGRF